MARGVVAFSCFFVQQSQVFHVFHVFPVFPAAFPARNLEAGNTGKGCDCSPLQKKENVKKAVTVHKKQEHINKAVTVHQKT